MKMIECATCKGQGYVYLNGFDAKTKELLDRCDPTLRVRAEAVGVATGYKCEFCHGEGQIIVKEESA